MLILQRSESIRRRGSKGHTRRHVISWGGERECIAAEIAGDTSWKSLLYRSEGDFVSLVEFCGGAGDASKGVDNVPVRFVKGLWRGLVRGTLEEEVILVQVHCHKSKSASLVWPASPNLAIWSRRLRCLATMSAKYFPEFSANPRRGRPRCVHQSRRLAPGRRRRPQIPRWRCRWMLISPSRSLSSAGSMGRHRGPRSTSIFLVRSARWRLSRIRLAARTSWSGSPARLMSTAMQCACTFLDEKGM